MGKSDHKIKVDELKKQLSGLLSPEEEKVFLATDLFILLININKTMSTLATISAITRIFQHWVKVAKDSIDRHPGANWLYPVLVSSVEHNLVTTKETITKLKIESATHGWEYLKNHRHIISHPNQPIYEQESVNQFFENELHIFDPKVVRFWGVGSSLFEWAEQNGIKTYEVMRPKIGLYLECIEATCSVLTYVQKDRTQIMPEMITGHMQTIFANIERDCLSAYERERVTGTMEGEAALQRYLTKREEERSAAGTGPSDIPPSSHNE